VAFYANKVLSSTQIQSHYAAGFFGVPASFSAMPQSQNAFAGENITLSSVAVGAPTITFQWKKNGVNLAGQTNSTLTVSNVFYTGDSDVYSVGATNSFGGAISSGAKITVYYPPTYANLTNGLVLHLTFDGNYNDSSGHGNNGTPVGSPSLVPGKIGSEAVSILTDTTNGTFNFVTLGNPADFQFGSSVDFSVAYWVQFPTNALPGDLPFLCSADNSTGGFGLTLAPAYKTGGWAWSLDNSSSVGAGIQGPANSINDGTWHNVVEVFNRTGNCSTFLDGELANATPITGIGDVDSGQPFNIGQDPTGTYGESGTYLLDDIGVWRRALTDIEARSVYIAGQTYSKSFDTFGPATLAIYKLSGGNVGIAWQAGTLKQSGKVTGPWTAVPGAAAPFYQIPSSATNTFYGVGP
jgi:Concanavalin A-like lectin/glucanases superfamily/Immunoglobulin I-set domain